MFYDTKSSLLGLLWFIVIAAVVAGGIYLIGSAVSDANKEDHKRQLECIASGGHMERLYNQSNLICTK